MATTIPASVSGCTATNLPQMIPSNLPQSPDPIKQSSPAINHTLVSQEAPSIRQSRARQPRPEGNLLNPNDISGTQGTRHLKSQLKALQRTLHQKRSEIAVLVESLSQRDEELHARDDEIEQLQDKLAEEEMEVSLLDGLLDTVYNDCEESVVLQNRLLRCEIGLVREENRLLRILGGLRDENDEDSGESGSDEEGEDSGDETKSVQHQQHQKRKVFALTEEDLDIVEGRTAKRQVTHLQATINDLEQRLKNASLSKLYALESSTASGHYGHQRHRHGPVTSPNSISSGSELDSESDTDTVRPQPSSSRLLPGASADLSSQSSPQSKRPILSSKAFKTLLRNGTTSKITFFSSPSPPSLAAMHAEGYTRQINDMFDNGDNGGNPIVSPSSGSVDCGTDGCFCGVWQSITALLALCFCSA